MTAAPESMLQTPNKDLLADALRRVHLTSAFFMYGDFSEPWGFESANEATLAAAFVPGARRLILLHLAVEGRFVITLATGERAAVNPGDAVMLPYCDPHSMSFPADARAVPILELMPAPPWHGTPVVCRSDGGGAPTRLLCGYLSCEDLLFSPVLRALPRLIHLKPLAGPAARWREASLRYMTEQGRDGALLSRLPELVFADCMLQYAQELPESEAGWLSALRDPLLARAMVLLHGQPERAWTVDSLARSVAVSRSVLAERFASRLGTTPMRYLAQWRMQLASDLLRGSTIGIAALAARLGYRSEAAFSRAFKRHLGASPASWREGQRHGVRWRGDETLTPSSESRSHRGDG